MSFIQWFLSRNAVQEASVFHVDVTDATAGSKAASHEGGSERPREAEQKKTEGASRDLLVFILNCVIFGLLILSFIVIVCILIFQEDKEIPDFLQSTFAGLMGYVGGAFSAYWRVGQGVEGV
jgi:hypothetical protein